MVCADLEASRKSRNVEASEIEDCWIGKSIIEQRIGNREYRMNAGSMILKFVSCSLSVFCEEQRPNQSEFLILVLTNDV